MGYYLNKLFFYLLLSLNINKTNKEFKQKRGALT